MTQRTETPPAPPIDDRLLPILWQAWREAPKRTRIAMAAILGSMLFTVVDQMLEVFGEGALDAVLFKGVAALAAILGSMLLALAYGLHSTTQKLAACDYRDPLRALRAEARGLSFESFSLNRLLLALPTLGMLSGILLMISVASLIPKLFAGKTSAFVGILIFGGMVVLALRTVTQTTRFLYRHAHEQAEVAARAQAEAGEAQLAALQAQMNPHFLFNALNTIASLVRTDPKAAESTVENLAGVLRRTLDRSRHTWRTVGDEVDYVKAYLAVEQERWGERLKVDWAIPDALRRLPLPPMTLQPLVENSLKHGLGPRLERGTLHVHGELGSGTLRLTVADDGVGFPPRHREGTGLENLRRRLATLYGEEAELVIGSPPSGSVVRLDLPVGGRGNGQGGARNL